MTSTIYDTTMRGLSSGPSSEIDPKCLGDAMQMTQGELAAMAGFHRSTLARNPGSRAVQNVLRPIATILSMAADMSGNLDKAVIWFRHQPEPAFGAKRPIDMVEAGKSQNVIEWLLALEDGAYG